MGEKKWDKSKRKKKLVDKYGKKAVDKAQFDYAIESKNPLGRGMNNSEIETEILKRIKKRKRAKNKMLK